MSGLTKEQAKRFAELLKEKGLQSSQQNHRIPTQNERAPVSLTYAQKQIWFFELMNPGSTAYHIHFGLHMSGKLNVTAFLSALQGLVKRHDILRTRIQIMDGKPTQVYDPGMKVETEILCIDADRDLTEEDFVLRLSRETLLQPFDLLNGPLVRFQLAQINEQTNVLLVTIHHMIADGWSTGIMLQEVSRHYSDQLNGSQETMPELSIQYADYAAWHNNRSGEWDVALDYWTEHLREAPALTELPLDFLRPDVQNYTGASLHFSTSPELTSRIHGYCQRNGITVFMFLLAAFNVLIMRYTEQEDLVLGIPLAGRDAPETRNLIGMFVNTIAIRTRLSGQMTFRELAAQIRDNVLAGFQNGHVPFYKLVEHLAPQRNLSHSLLFQIMFMMQDTPMPDLKIHDIDLRLLKTEYGSSQFDLSVSWKEGTGNLEGIMEYNTTLFKRGTIQRIQQHYVTLLDQICKDPDKRIARLSLINAWEEERVRCQGKNEMELEKESLIELFERQVATTPRSLAMFNEDERLTYQELEAKANRLAHYIKNRGVCANSYVGIMLERSSDFVVAALAVLKADSVYIPLEPHAPTDRSLYMLLHSGASMLITAEACFNQRLTQDLNIILVDREAEIIATGPAEPLKRETSIDQKKIAAVIYTSGTTGKPKGVMLEHRGLINLVQSFIDTYQVRTNDRLLPVTSVASASFIGEIFPMLCAGGSLYLPEYRELLDMEKLCKSIRKHEITIMSSVPSFIAFLNRQHNEVPHLRLILSGGEALHYDEFDKLLPSKVIVNSYGLTESTVCSAYHIIRQDEICDANTLPIGKPIRHTQIYVMDRYLNCMPVGCIGEICITGVGVSPGYIHNDSLTSERFVEHPWYPGRRMLRTGDKGRWLEDGTIEYLGRMDKQFKIRGFRIEPGEIEARIRQYPGVQNVSVQIRQWDEIGRFIVAYIQPEPENSLHAASIKDWLRIRLPEYMVPSKYYLVRDFPLNMNGKTDATRLDELAIELPINSIDTKKSETVLEQKLAEIWKEILKLDQVSIEHNFFDLGGHSLLLADVFSRVKKEINPHIQLVDLFKYPSIASLAVYLSQTGKSQHLNEQVIQRIKKQKASIQQRKAKMEHLKPKGGA
ncbi:non-ribosomal peptide synthetase [Paenibacillus oleatilyticus]|uniref:Amino acid adenylation domain-containing protein n=1 Tax=Paenibacillus oleatilyticus TaxID=2594886 RepID=A0ABV4VA50_9BACL